MSIQNESIRIVGRASSAQGQYSSTNGYDNESGNGTAGRRSNEHEPSFAGSFVKSIIFGGIDGLLISIALTSGAAGGQFAWNIVLCVGLSSVIANALHLGIGEYLSSKAHRDFVNTEKRREQWEFKNFKEGEIAEMINIFEERGMARADAEIVVRKMSEYDSFFINMMITEELGLQIPEEDDALLLKDSIVMFLSFAFFGALPLVVYVAGPWDVIKPQDMYNISILISALCLFSLGSAKCSFSSVFWLFAGLETLIMGALCAGVAFGVGDLIRTLLES